MRPFPEASYPNGRPSVGRRMRAVIRPRMTWRYLVCSLATIYVLYCFLFSLPLFASPLPQYSGPYSVGAIDIEAPLADVRTIDPARFRDTQENAFDLETVLLTVYYPTSSTTSRQPRHHWIPKPVSVTAEGYAKFGHINNFVINALLTGALSLLAGGIQIPAHVDVPIATHLTPEVSNSHASGLGEKVTEKVLETEGSGLPVIVFSHGMASSRTDYTHYAGELASRGYVVAMIEHRDGSSPGSVVMKGGEPHRTRLMFRMSEVESAEGRAFEVDDFKRAQLNFRGAEIEEAVRVLKQINDGHGEAVFQQNPRQEGTHLADWAGILNTDEMIVAGHSYGATGAMQALKGGPSRARPFKGAIVLDPGKSSGRLNDDIRVPLLVIHSNSWSSKHSVFYGRPHFDTVREIVQDTNDGGNASWFMTSLGTSHPSVTDAPLLEPLLLQWTTGAEIDVYEGLRQYVHVSSDFLSFLDDGEKRNLLAEKAEFPEYDPGKGFGTWKPGQGDNQKNGGAWWDWRRYWQVHVSAV
ncbi:PAF acetylhydrolase [Xylariomycetidae sp. FL2044]|nr:PAF acetylhydrolase [Xylariomycetidae sp. FL2044]